MPLAVVAVCTHETLALRCFRASCRQQGIRPHILGMGQPWGGFGWRLKLLLQTLRERQGEWEHVLFIDGFDSVVTGDLDEILAKFRAIGSRLVFAAETNCWPGDPDAEEYPASPFRYRFLNGGGFLGRVDYLIQVMDELEMAGLGNHAIDQQHWAKAFVSGRFDIKLDVGCEIFHCLFEARADLVFEKRILNRSTRTRPAIFHGNGNTKYEDVTAHILGYRYVIQRWISKMRSEG